MFPRFLYAAFAAISLILLTGTALADPIAVTYEDPGIQSVGAPTVCQGTTLCTFGTEAFNSPLAAGGNASLAGGVITADYTGNYVISPADQYGGAGGTGNYITTGGTYSVSLTNTSAIPGINYFGFWLSALDGGNQLTLTENGQNVFSFTPADLIEQLGGCSGGNAYCGNPNSGADAKEQFAFVSFFDPTGYFNGIIFDEDPSVGGYESDNHTFGYRNPNIPFGTLVPEPPAIGIFIFGLAVLGIMSIRRISGSVTRG